MLNLFAVATVIGLFASGVAASSTDRNPITKLGIVRNAEIHTSNGRITALSSFELTFELFDRPVRLSLEPNHDILPDGASVTYLGPDGSIVRTEPIARLDHKVFKGVSWAQNVDGSWQRAGAARIYVRRDGERPLFEGHYTVRRNHHHVQLSASYMQTKQPRDPAVELRDDEYMVVFRDSDIAAQPPAHAELRRRQLDEGAYSCGADVLDFNTQPDHPVYARSLRREEPFWSMPVSALFGKRQMDTPTGGNSAGVNLVSTIGQTQGCPTTRKVALVGVAADCEYMKTFGNSTDARENIIKVINSASAIYESTFNITLGLANLTLSDANCPGTPPSSTPWNEACSDSITIQDRLNTFSGWRGTQSDKNSHWTLLTNCKTGSAVGLAWLGQACVQGFQTSNGTDGVSETVASANVVARTSTEWQVIAHETGHTFGAVHDCTSQTCNDGSTVAAQMCCPLSAGTCDAGEQYIMNPSTAPNIDKFSPCSIGNICAALGRGSVKSDCLTNNKGIPTITGQQCGNGIVEDGEDCDCGGEQSCGSNACCDPKTCKFKDGAVCDDSNEDCCRGCQLAPANTVCRASTGVCDPEEKCTGSSPYCPDDKTANDGTSCGSGLKCASGQCTSRDLQCRTVMGSYTRGNDTYACDSSTCQLSCASPEFGQDVCYGLQQNFLDGTECGGGGHCQNGICKGSSLTKEISSWISKHKALVIGIGAAAGGLFLLSVLGCVVRCFRRRKMPKPGPRPRNAVSTWQDRGRRPPGGAPGPYDSQGPLVGQAGTHWYGYGAYQPPYRNQYPDRSVRYA